MQPGPEPAHCHRSPGRSPSAESAGATTPAQRDTWRVVMADPDETCPGLWVEIDFEIGYCSLGDEWRNPIPDAHPRRSNERPVIDTNDL